jgi:aminopeptidase YwaD
MSVNATLEEILMASITHLSAEIGARPIGSLANQSAADYIHDTFQSAGLDVEEQPYPCTAWEHISTLLEMEGEKLEVTANAFCLSCDISAPVVCAGSVPELETAAVTGKILLLHGDLARAPLSPKSWFLLDDRDRHVIDLLERLQPAAILAPPTATDYFGNVTEDAELNLAAATVSSAAALRLIGQQERPVHLRIDAQRLPAVARNIVGRRPGGGPGKIVLMAHLDTKINTPGATDNGGGVAILLALAERLRADCTLEFVAFNGEEYLPMGDDEYLRLGEGNFPNILAAVNFDGAGAALGSNSVTAMSGSPEFDACIRSAAREFPGVVWVEPWPESNHSTFAFRGVPAVAFSAVGTRCLAHSQADSVEQISPAKLAEVFGMAEVIVKGLAGKPAGWGRTDG